MIIKGYKGKGMCKNCAFSSIHKTDKNNVMRLIQ
jgi:hypothetical protein